MINLKAIGRVFFAIPIVVFGIQYLAYGRFVRGLPPVPPWAPGGAAGAYLTGALLVAAGVCSLANVQIRLSAAALGAFCLVCVVALHTMSLTAVIHQGGERTGALEALALAAAAWVLAASSPAGVSIFHGWQRFTEILGKPGLLSVCVFRADFWRATLHVRALHRHIDSGVDARALIPSVLYWRSVHRRRNSDREQDTGASGSQIARSHVFFVDSAAACSASICSYT
jgi:uncharacterized membrane protein YphA (DoxX/SURF4 family)